MTPEQRNALPFEVSYKDKDGNTRYARIEKFEDDFEEHFNAGCYLVSDNILPKMLSLPIDDCTPHEINYSDWQNDPMEKWVRADQEAAKALAAKNPSDRLCKNDLFSLPVADGAAHYVVTKVNKKTVDIEWRGWCADRYTDRILGWGGRFRREDIERLVLQGKRMAAVWAKQTA